MRRILWSLTLVLCGLQGATTALASNDADLQPATCEHRNFKNISPLVVNVHKLRTMVTSDFVQRDVQTGMGSGFLSNQQGYVVTNYHVVVARIKSL